MDATYIPVLNTILSSLVSLVVAFGTWHISMKKDREKQVDEVKSILNAHREEYLKGIRDVQDDVTQVNATVQNQIGIIEVEIKNLSTEVEKHNKVMERTFALENKTAVHDEKLNSVNHRLDELEKKG